MTIVAANAKRIMSERGLKQGYVANKAGFDEKLYSAMLNGRKIIRAEYIPQIANALGVSPGDLFAPLPVTENTA